MADPNAGPHADQPIATAGASLEDATAAMVLCHGRGATARSILQFGTAVATDDVAVLAPQAARNAWYPNSFMAPIESNQPWLDSALDRVDSVLTRVTEAGIPLERTLLGGFSQGACLASEYAVRNPTRYGAVVALSGGLIGPEGTSFEYDGTLEGTRAFVGCSDVDPHIPLERVQETTETLTALDADVDERIYEGMGHTINADEQSAVSTLVADL